jgi:hypothetical protein
MRLLICALVIFLQGGLLLRATPSLTQNTECRGTQGTPGSAEPLGCTGSCTQGSCDARNGSGTWSGYKVCNCSLGSAPSACCGLVMKRLTGAAVEFFLSGDCIGCGWEDRTCTMKTSPEGTKTVSCPTTLPDPPDPE